MDFASTPEQALLQRTAREVLAAIAPMSQVRAMMADARGITYPDENNAAGRVGKGDNRAQRSLGQRQVVSGGSTTSSATCLPY
jgi:hypothetical protein